KKALLKAGFDADELDALMARLTEESEQATVTLDTLFDQLLDVPMDQPDAAETEPDHFLETSSLPALETILNDLGIPADQVREILARADKGEKGISLDTVIDRLRQLQKQSFYTQNHYQSSMNEDTLVRLLNQLGIENRSLKNGGFNLHDLVGEFENLKNQSMSKLLPEAKVSSPSAGSGDKQSDLLNDLFKSLALLSASKDKNGFEFSRDQIKNHFKNELLASEAAGLNSAGSHLTGLNSKGLFATQNDKKISKDQLIKEGLKEMGRSLDGKSGQTPGMKGALLENREFINQLKNRLTGLTDESHSSLSETKSSDPQAGQTVSKFRGAAKTLPAFVTQQVSKSIVKAVNQGESTLRINLKPPELGRLMLTIDNSGNSMRVNVVAETAAARDVLLSNANELRTVLSNSGVHLERFDVDMNSDFRQSMADAKNQAGNFNKRNRNKEDQESDPLTNTASNESITLTDMIESGESLHFVA
ncbi:MAG: flagellar hook-length control protein FliK, partial [Desulfobacterales bacterium]|nr:flagellar hook-length control protein FliK [Desulfobacterales bacterium]